MRCYMCFGEDGSFVDPGCGCDGDLRVVHAECLKKCGKFTCSVCHRLLAFTLAEYGILVCVTEFCFCFFSLGLFLSLVISVAAMGSAIVWQGMTGCGWLSILLGYHTIGSGFMVGYRYIKWTKENWGQMPWSTALLIAFHAYTFGWVMFYCKIVKFCLHFAREQAAKKAVKHAVFGADAVHIDQVDKI